MLESCLAVLNVIEKGTRLYDWFTGVSSGDQFKRVMADLESTRREVKQLSDHLLYAPAIQQLSVPGPASRLTDPRTIREFLEPVAVSLHSQILASAVLSTPERLRDKFEKDPWELLVEVRPATRVRRPTNPDLFPVVFIDDAIPYVGWQTRGALPLLFGCEFDESAKLYVDDGAKPITQEANDALASGDYVRAAALYSPEANRGDSYAQIGMGIVSFALRQNSTAVAWLEASARQGNSYAMVILAEHYYQGDGVQQDYQKARQWAVLAAEHGEERAEFILGLMYERGEGVRQSPNEAARWYTRASQRNGYKPWDSNAARFHLARMHLEGRGVPKDFDKALALYKSAALNGLAEAQTKLGELYYKGTEVAPSPIEAFRWMKMAADQGDGVGEFNVGFFYEKGIGVSKDKDEALYWYRQAAAKGVAAAPAAIRNLG